MPTFEDLPGLEFEDLGDTLWDRGAASSLTWREYMAVKLITDNLLSQDNLLSAFVLLRFSQVMNSKVSPTP
jgi:hypothetical protein